MSFLLGGKLANVSYDSNLAPSLVSAAYVEQNLQHLLVTGDLLSTSVSVPTNSTSNFTSVITFTVSRRIQFDAVLGVDWLGICRAVIDDGLVTFPPSSRESQFQPGSATSGALH